MKGNTKFDLSSNDSCRLASLNFTCCYLLCSSHVEESALINVLYLQCSLLQCKREENYRSFKRNLVFIFIMKHRILHYPNEVTRGQYASKTQYPD